MGVAVEALFTSALGLQLPWARPGSAFTAAFGAAQREHFAPVMRAVNA